MVFLFIIAQPISFFNAILFISSQYHNIMFSSLRTLILTRAITAARSIPFQDIPSTPTYLIASRL